MDYRELFRWIWLIPVLPALGALLNGLFGRRLFARFGRPAVNAIALGSTGLALVLALGMIAGYRSVDYAAAPSHPSVTYHATHAQVRVDVAPWITGGPSVTDTGTRGGFTAPWAFTLDALSCIMLFLVTFVGYLIHVFATAYMKDDPSYWRFFCYLNLFMASMLVLILGANMPVMFVGWEGVGLCSYLLIGFWFKDNANASAGKKAFITNRIGDVGFVIGAMLLFRMFGTLDFAALNDGSVRAVALGLSPALLNVAALCLFLGACGKSAQIPLYVWLPDAMAGPTPVSALIHAATMVTSGVYMMARLNGLFASAPSASVVIALVGAATALWAGSFAMVQNDIKKVLAYSTVSQLGFMVLAMGVGAYEAGVFHLFTHGFFKALLFLGAGSVIAALHHEQDIRRMGGLRQYMPVTWLTFAVGTLAIAGIPPFSGFFSKDEILWRAFSVATYQDWMPHWLGWVVWAMGIATALLTSFYMFRLYYLVFHGPERTSPALRGKVTESPSSMTFPLVFLAGGAAGLGFLGMPAVLRSALGGGHGANLWESFLGKLRYFPLELPHDEAALAIVHKQEWILLGMGVMMGVFGWIFARTLYNPPGEEAEAIAANRPRLYNFLAMKGHVDEFYRAAFILPFMKACEVFRWVDRWIVDGFVNLLGLGYQVAGILLRQVQSGYIRRYGLAFVVGLAALLLYVVF